MTDEHLDFSARAAIAYHEVIHRHELYAFGYYWWGQTEFVTQLRSQSTVAVSRLASLGRPAEALPKLEAALEMLQRIFEGDSPDVAGSLNDLAACL